MPPLVLLAALTGAFAFKQSSPPNRSRDLVDAVHRSGSVQRCWNAYVHQVPNGTSARFRLRVEVAPDGHVTSVSVLDPAPTPLTGCIQTQVGQLALPAGTAVTIEATYAFDAGRTVPVPMTPPAAH